MIKSDLILENSENVKPDNVLSIVEKLHNDVKIKEYVINDDSKYAVLGKKKGKYVSMEFKNYRKNVVVEISDSLSDMILKLCGIPKSVLCVGIGNPKFVCDLLGTETCVKIHKSYVETFCFLPSTSSNTGIDSLTAIKGICKELKPDLVIAVDSLCAFSHERIGKVCQISNSGIDAGSTLGIGKSVDFDELGVHVVGIGIPTVFSVVNGENMGKILATKHDIEKIVEECSDFLSEIITRSLKDIRCK